MTADPMTKAPSQVLGEGNSGPPGGDQTAGAATRGPTRAAPTRGPWGVEVGRSMAWVGPMRPDGRKVDEVVVSVECGHGYREDFSAQQFANAQLIAAAPDMAKALADLLTVAELTTFSDQYPRECEAARAALSQALGGDHG